MRILILLLSCMPGWAAAVVIDRMAVTVGTHVIKASEIERDLRLTEFLNREPLNLSAEARRKAAERLIDQQIIRTELAAGRYKRATDANAEALLRQIEHDRFGGVEARMRSELARYGLTEQDLRSQLLWQLTVLTFIQQRFQAGAAATDQEVRAYYDQHLDELKRQNPGDGSFQALEPKIRTLLEGQGVNRDFEDWLTRTRQRNRIEYRQGAFQ